MVFPDQILVWNARNREWFHVACPNGPKTCVARVRSVCAHQLGVGMEAVQLICAPDKTVVGREGDREKIDIVVLRGGYFCTNVVDAATPIFVCVKTLRGQKETVEMRSSDKVADLQQRVLPLWGVPAHQQRLIYQHQELDSLCTLASYANLLAHRDQANPADITLVMRLRGGGYRSTTNAPLGNDSSRNLVALDWNGEDFTRPWQHVRGEGYYGEGVCENAACVAHGQRVIVCLEIPSISAPPNPLVLRRGDCRPCPSCQVSVRILSLAVSAQSFSWVGWVRDAVGSECIKSSDPVCVPHTHYARALPPHGREWELLLVTTRSPPFPQPILCCVCQKPREGLDGAWTSTAHCQHAVHTACLAAWRIHTRACGWKDACPTCQTSLA